MATKKELEQQLTDKLLELLKDGQKIAAIKVHKAVTGEGLKESKEFIEQFAKDHGIENIATNKKCFIATACYEHEDAMEVDLFRMYRDEYLSKNRIGKWFIRLYYTLSPSLANILYRSPRLKRFVRKSLLQPMIRAIIKNHLLFDQNKE